jgi:hypothetical protein
MSAHRFVWRGRGGRDALLASNVLAELVGSKQWQAAHDAQLNAFGRLDEPRAWWEGARSRTRRKAVEGQLQAD